MFLFGVHTALTLAYIQPKRKPDSSSRNPADVFVFEISSLLGVPVVVSTDFGVGVAHRRTTVLSETAPNRVPLLLPGAASRENDFPH